MITLADMSIISGGQTGADMRGIKAGRYLSIPTGGFAAKDWMTERGPAPWLADYGLTPWSQHGYLPRTRANVELADGTVIFGNPDSAGSRMIVNHCRTVGKPYIIIRLQESGESIAFTSWLKAFDIAVLNTAGNRESVCPGIENHVFNFLIFSLATTL